MSNVVVIGAGQAGASLVARLRKQGFKGDVTLIGEEPVIPYQRPPLSKKYLIGEMELERLYLRPESFYADQNITLRTGTRVLSIERDAKTVSLDNETLDYDNLAITTGSSPRRLPAAIGGDLDGVYVVRNLENVDAMEPEFKEGRRVLIVGGGYIGLEAASVAASRGLKVTLVEASDRILQRVAAPETSDFFRKLHQNHGVEILEGVGLKKLNGSTRVASATLTKGNDIDVDFVIVGIGITPDTSLAEVAGLEIDNGIRVDQQCRTSDPNIYAAGDCASFPYGDGYLRLESVPSAIDQGESVANAIMGDQTPYLAKPWFWSDQYDTKLQIAGLNTGYDQVVTRDSDGPISFWYFKERRLLAVDAANDPRSYMTAKRWIEAGQSPSPNDVSDTTIELKTMDVTG